MEALQTSLEGKRSTIGSVALNEDGVEVAAGQHNGAYESHEAVGNGNHLALVKLHRAQGGDWRHIPYKGAGPALVGLLGGETDAAIVALPAAQPHIQAGRLRALAVVQERRSSLAPDVPTLAQAGITIDLENGWFGLLAPAGTPQAVVDRVQQAVTSVLADPEFRTQLARQGFEPVGSSSQAFARQLDRDVATFPPLLKSLGARVE